ncbi:unnamed protein product [Auanema sp. JU1783]|nr:unnamed protein product [Auanema sp. JU1783]
MVYWKKLLPPYYKYSVFLFVGFEFIYSAVVLAISEAYYKSAALVLPIAYEIFDDTVQKQVPDFDWTPAEKHQLEMYMTKMLFMWAISTVGVIVCMLIIIPQFFDFNDKRGNPSHLCLVRRKIGWALFYIVAIYVLVLGLSVYWAWLDCGKAVQSFHDHFTKSEKEEQFLTILEEKLECTTDDDKELCEQNIRMSFISDLWIDLLFYTYVAGHSIAFLAIPFFNKQLIKPDDDDIFVTDDKKLIEA